MQTETVKDYADVETIELPDLGSEREAGVTHEIALTYDFLDYRDPVTQYLGILASTWDGNHKNWQANAARARIAPHARAKLILGIQRDESRRLRDSVGEELTRELKKHALYPWLLSHRGCPKSTHTARVIAMIRDPLRFPGCQCAVGHYLPVDHNGACTEQVRVGSGKTAEWVSCGAEVGAPRRGTGTRALWHYLGLHVVDGVLPKRTKGQQADWSTKGRTACLMPDGIADMIIRQKVEPWYGVYLAAKARKGGKKVEEEKVSAGLGDYAASDERCETGRSIVEGGGVEALRADAVDPGLSALTLPPWHAHKIGRIVLVKAFVADMLAEWKRIVLAAKED